ncbi:hypothetical protein BD309DRAFT_1043054 [Dichomitus squalens]|uniref:Nephrocystin 3-like N-terminal domain-containing protein n=1 Tax=Dichomitus squalens TaxID=114155 RepID=A0A4Q9Q322_9APHY|nr:hypothetical protein BD309DRAFT_1043054 [Dichomitus squalens]TBU61539.1 hypothetical protein BD310DRAFT_975148 [Dichomitus squalens]
MKLLPPERRSTIDDILNWSKTGLEWGKHITSVFPIPGGVLSPHLFALVLNTSFGQSQAARTNEEDVESLLIELKQLAEVVGKSKHDIDDHIESTLEKDQVQGENALQSPREVEDHFKKFEFDLRGLSDQSKALKHSNFLPAWLFSSRDARTISKIKSDVAKAREYFETSCLVAIQTWLENIDKKLQHITVAVTDIGDRAEVERREDADDRILDALPRADAGYNSSFNQLKGRFLEGTRAKLFEKLEAWIEVDSSHKPICVLTGGAGTGKSTVAFELAKRLDERYHRLGASFFFIRGIADLDSTRLFFPTLAYQLAHSQDVLRKHIVDSAREHLKKGRTQAMEREAPALLHNPLSLVGKQDPPIFLVVDAVDECTEDPVKLVQEMLDFLMATTQHGPIRIFLTVRPVRPIEAKLSSAKWTTDVHTISLETSSNDATADILAFIKDSFSRIPQGPELLKKRGDIAYRLAQQAQGLFIYARTAIDFLETYPGPLEEGVGFLLSDVAEEAVALGPLDQLYLVVLENAFPPAHMQQLVLRARVQVVLGCVAVLRNPVSPRILEKLTLPTRRTITCQDTVSVLDRLRSVVIFENGSVDEAFRPMHATFSQFLVDPTRCTNALYLVDTQRQHAHMADACLKAVLSLEQNMCRLEESELEGSIQDIADIESRLIHVPQHVQYACVYWVAHLREACRPLTHAGHGCFCGDLVVLLENFVANKMLQWMETLGLMGRVDGAMDALGAARDWLPREPQYTHIRERINHGRQILFNHTDGIRNCPHSVYKVSTQEDGDFTLNAILRHRPAIVSDYGA